MINSSKQFLRLLHINIILAKNGLDQVIVSLRLFAPFRFILFLNPWNWFRKEHLSRGVALRKTLIELGPIFVKFGQALSTRPDILPTDIAYELSLLQDSVPPFPSEEALSIIEKTFKKPAHQLFRTFEEIPIASASVAQVHAATLEEGQEVVVKILRPGIRKKIAQDLAILHSIAHLAERYWPEGRRFKPIEIVQEFEKNLLEELDLRREAANASQLGRNFEHSPLLYVPKIYWEFVRQNILVMERIYGISVNDLTTLQQHQVNIKKLAERGVEIFFTQVFRDCFFHADMHPGNIFVSYKNPEDPQYICVDFGIMGTLGDADKLYLAENLLAFFNRDYRRVAELHVESGWVPRSTRINEFESAIRTVCEPIIGKPLREISFGLVVLNLIQVGRRFHMEVQPQLILLQKTLLAVEGLGRQLYPSLDLWATAKPYLQKWLQKDLGPTNLVKTFYHQLPFIVEELPQIPKLVKELLVLSKEQKLLYFEEKKNSQPLYSQKQNWSSGFGFGIFFSMLALSGLLYFKWMPKEEAIYFSFVMTVIGGLLALLNQTRRH